MELNKLQRRIWLFNIKQLKKHFNPGVPTRVQTRHLQGFCGECDGVVKLGRLIGISIRINSNLTWHSRVETLIHEWAHAMEWESSWRDDSFSRIHGETWGVWYAKIYQHLFDRCWVEMGKRGLLTEAQLKAFPLDEYEWKK